MTEARQGRPSGAHLVYLELKRRILDLELEPGQRLHEVTLATSLAVSRTPLREAIRRLLSENLLQQQPTGGVVVPRLDAGEISELYDVRAALEGLMAAEACKKATAEDLETLGGIVERNAAMVRFADDAMELGQRLHARIGSIASNGWALRLNERVSNQMQRYRVYTNHTQERRDQALAEHRLIHQAIADGDPEHASAVAFDHVLGARDQALRAIGPADDVGAGLARAVLPSRLTTVETKE